MSCNCAPDLDGVIIHNSWAHPEWFGNAKPVPNVTDLVDGDLT